MLLRDSVMFRWIHGGWRSGGDVRMGAFGLTAIVVLRYCV